VPAEIFSTQAMWVLIFDLLQQLLKGRSGNYTFKLGVNILGDINMVDHHIEHFPLPIDVMQPVVNR